MIITDMKWLRRFYFSTLFLPFIVIRCDLTTSSQDEYTTAFTDTFWVTAEPRGPRSISVKWSMSDSYKREWHIAVYTMAQRLMLTANASPETSTYKLMGLHPGTRYSIVIGGYQSNGTKWLMDPVIVTTPDEPKSNQTTSSYVTREHIASAGVTIPYGSDGNGRENISPRNNQTTGGGTKFSGYRMLKWAVIAACSGVGALAFFFLLFFIVYKVQRKSDMFTLRRNTRTESMRDNKHLDENDTDTKEEKKDDAEKGQEKKEEKEAKKDKKESKKDKKEPKKNKNRPTLLALPQLENNQTSRSNAFSGISWGSEFDALEQGDNIYSNDDLNPQLSSQTQSNTKTRPAIFAHSKSMRSPHQQNEMIYNNTTTSPPPLTRHLSLQSERPPPTYHDVHRENSPDQQQAAWKQGHGIDIVIPTPSQNQTQGKGAYSNVKDQNDIYANTDQNALYVNNDQNALYVNSEDIDMDLPPPIPRR